MASELLDLLGLLIYNTGGMGNLIVDKLLVGLVNERSEEEDGGGEEAETPEWNDLDEVVGDERA